MPFNCSEVLKALSKTRELFDRWKSADEGREVRSVEEQEWAATELRNSLRSIEWDLEDLDDTVQVRNDISEPWEKNPTVNFTDRGEEPGQVPHRHLRARCPKELHRPDQGRGQADERQDDSIMQRR